MPSIADLLRPPYEEIDPVKFLLNVGACLDVPTGDFVEGRHGEWILNGGLGTMTGVTGIGNCFKTTTVRYMEGTVLARFADSTVNEYDTEMNAQPTHIARQVRRIPDLNGEDVFAAGRWQITDGTKYSGNKWYAIQKEFLENKKKNRDKLERETPFWNRDRTGPLKMMIPTVSNVDSFSRFETDDIIDMQDSNELGDSGANTIHMRQGLAKQRFLIEAPRINGSSNNYIFLTAHIGQENNMQQVGGGRQVPIVKLKYLKNGDKIKGATDQYTYLLNNLWHFFNAAPLINDGTKGPEYPRDSDDNLKLDTDLNYVQLRNLRGKAGASGMTITLIVSQTEGVLPSLTEFHHIKEQGRYGLEGNNVNYNLALYPECKLSRTTVRGKIDSDPKLRRALNITSEMCQMSYLWHHLDEELYCTPKQLYDDLTKMGYDWDLLLNTRGWWTLDNDKHPIPFLSTMDLLLCRLGKYHPYWMNPDKKSIKDKYSFMLPYVLAKANAKIKQPETL